MEDQASGVLYVDESMLNAEQLIELRKPQAMPNFSSGQKTYIPSGDLVEVNEVENLMGEYKNSLQIKRVAKANTMMHGVWDVESRRAEIDKLKGKRAEHMGVYTEGKMTLSPEESLFLIEGGTLELLRDGVPMSSEEAYAVLLNENLGLEKYQVFAYLTRLGFLVVMHHEQINVTVYEKKINLDKHRIPKKRKKRPLGRKSKKQRLLELHRRTFPDIVRNHDADLGSFQTQMDSLSESRTNFEQKSVATKSREVEGIAMPVLDSTTDVAANTIPNGPEASAIAANDSLESKRSVSTLDSFCNRKIAGTDPEIILNKGGRISDHRHQDSPCISTGSVVESSIAEETVKVSKEHQESPKNAESSVASAAIEAAIGGVPLKNLDSSSGLEVAATSTIEDIEVVKDTTNSEDNLNSQETVLEVCNSESVSSDIAAIKNAIPREKLPTEAVVTAKSVGQEGEDRLNSSLASGAVEDDNVTSTTNLAEKFVAANILVSLSSKDNLYDCTELTSLDDVSILEDEASVVSEQRTSPQKKKDLLVVDDVETLSSGSDEVSSLTSLKPIHIPQFSASRFHVATTRTCPNLSRRFSTVDTDGFRDQAVPSLSPKRSKSQEELIVDIMENSDDGIKTLTEPATEQVSTMPEKEKVTDQLAPESTTIISNDSAFNGSTKGLPPQKQLQEDDDSHCYILSDENSAMDSADDDESSVTLSDSMDEESADSVVGNRADNDNVCEQDIELVEVTKKCVVPLDVIDLSSDEECAKVDDDDIQIIGESKRSTIPRDLQDFMPSSASMSSRGYQGEDSSYPLTEADRKYNSSLKWPLPNLHKKTTICLPRPPGHLLPPTVRMSKEAYAIELNMITQAGNNTPRVWNSYRDLQARGRPGHGTNFSMGRNSATESPSAGYDRLNSSAVPTFSPVIPSIFQAEPPPSRSFCMSPSALLPLPNVQVPMMSHQMHSPSLLPVPPMLPSMGDPNQLQQYIKMAQQRAMQTAQDVFRSLTHNLNFPFRSPRNAPLPETSSHQFNLPDNCSPRVESSFMDDSPWDVTEINQSSPVGPYDQSSDDSFVVDSQMYPDQTRAINPPPHWQNNRRRRPPMVRLPGTRFEHPYPCELPQTSNKVSSWKEFKVNVGCTEEESVVSQGPERSVNPHAVLWSGPVCPLWRSSGSNNMTGILKCLKLADNANLMKSGVKFDQSLASQHSLSISFDVYLPGSRFRKSCPTIPSHRIVVVRSTDPFPKMADVVALQRKFKDGASLQFAIVDGASISFFSMNEVHLPTFSPEQ